MQANWEWTVWSTLLTWQGWLDCLNLKYFTVHAVSEFMVFTIQFSRCKCWELGHVLPIETKQLKDVIHLPVLDLIYSGES